MEFIFSEFEDPNLENFLGDVPIPPVNGLGPIVEYDLSLERSWKTQGIPSLLENGSPDYQDPSGGP